MKRITIFKRIQKWQFPILFVILFIVVSEFTLRKVWGFCDAPLCIENNKYEYIFAPNQDRYRFRYHIHYNSFSQRSDEPRINGKIILGLGDSVINGGAQTDQDSLATTLFTNETGIQMLNISAGSWGPDNCAAYLRENGLFNACGMVVVLSSHDAHDVMDFKPVVGFSNSYPKEQYKSAILELFDRYIIPRLMNKIHIDEKKEGYDPDAAANAAAGNGILKDNGEGFNPGWEQLRLMAKNANIPFAVYLHAEKPEVIAGKYNNQGEEIITWAKTHDVKLYKGLDMGECEADFRDNIHLNSRGQKLLSQALLNICEGW